MTPRTTVVGSVFALVAGAGCFSFTEPPASELEAPVKVPRIEDATIMKMQVHLGEQPGLCPGKVAKLYATAHVQWPGRPPVVRTIGSDVDSLAPDSFEVTGPLVRGDANAHLIVETDVLRSIASGFAATVVYKPQPAFTFEQIWRPEYSCYRGWFADGHPGTVGASGSSGSSGSAGGSGSSGGRGADGGSGTHGGRVVAAVTIVATPYYPRLLAAWVIQGETEHFFLAPSFRPLTFGAAGGRGGSGGSGGSGGAGGDQSWSNERTDNGSTVKVGSGSAGNGGDGGSGGNGGNGGNGGTVEVVYESSFPELKPLIQTDVRGGAGGAGGGAGSAGRGGGSSADRNRQTGHSGTGGSHGASGRSGTAGRAVVRSGRVNDKLAGLHGIAIYGTPAASSLPPAPVLPQPPGPARTPETEGD